MRLLLALLPLVSASYGQIDNPVTASSLGLGATDSVTFDRVATTANGSFTNPAIRIGASNTGLISVSGFLYGVSRGESVFAASPTGFTIVPPATFSTNVTVNGSLTAAENTVLSGVNNTMPNATTAASEASLMTRDLVGHEFANPRNKMQTTYWFGLQGLGGWQTVNSGATAIANRTPKFGPSLAFYAPAKPATSASGVGVRLGATGITGAGAWRPADGGAFTARSHVVNYYSATGAGNLAFGFSFAAGNNTNFWAAPDCFGLFWVQQPTNSWAASTAFAQHDRIAVSNVVWAVATAGTTAATAPTWTDLIGSVVTNGTAVFRNIGPHTSNNWVLAIGHTNASQVVMTNTGKSNWLRSTGGSGHDVLLALRYGTNTTGPYTVYGSVADGTGQGSEVALNLAANTTQVSPQYWLRYDGTNTTTGNEAAGIRYFSIDAELPPLN